MGPFLVHKILGPRPPPPRRALLEGEGGHRGSPRAVAERSQGAVGGGGFWRLEMRSGLVLGYGNAFGVESVQWGGGRGTTPPPHFKRFSAPLPPESCLTTQDLLWGEV